MVKLRLQRFGTKKRPFYRVVAANANSPRDGRFIERLGFYNPVGGENQENLRLQLDRIEYWTNSGAQMSPAVARLVKEYAKKVDAAA